jgi:sulfatase modifying factor 1
MTLKPLHISLACLSMAGIASASTIQFVDVLDAGNVADTNGRGAVAYDFRIMKFEFTNAEYAHFLNTVDPNASSSLLWNSNMSNALRGGLTKNIAAPVGSRYSVKTDWGNKPIGAISWFDAARVANWLHNGGTASSSTETGAYTLTGLTEAAGTLTVARNPGALFWIPTRDEWYKAAYYNGDSTYWNYATESDTAPTSITSNGSGDGSAGPNGNFANFNNGATWNGVTSNGIVTSVGTNGRSSHYGTYDMSGNVREIVEGSAGATDMVLVGGGYSTAAASLSSSGTPPTGIAATASSALNGFRLATITPEPGSTIPLLTLFGLGMAKSRRRKA